MHRKLPPLNALRAFEAVAAAASFTGAAERLHVTHGAVSRQVASLEAHLGVRLFVRLPRGVALTPEGETLLASVAAAFELIESGAGRIAAARRDRPLVVSCIATFTMRWLIPRLYRFQVRHPGIEVRLSAPNPPENLSPADTEVAIRVTPAEGVDGKAGRPFLAERIGPVASPETLSRLPVATAADLARHTLLYNVTRPTAWAEWAQVAGVWPPPVGVRRFETFYFLLQAAASGLGVALAPLPLVEDDLAAGRLLAPLGFVPGGRRYVAYHPVSAAGDPRVAAFCDWLVEEGAAAGQSA